MNVIDQWLTQTPEWFPYVLPALGFLLGCILTWSIQGYHQRTLTARLEEKLRASEDGTNEARQRLALLQREVDAFRTNEGRLLRQQGELEGQLKVKEELESAFDDLDSGISEPLEIDKNQEELPFVPQLAPAVKIESRPVTPLFSLPKKDEQAVKEIFSDRRAAILEAKKELQDRDAFDAKKTRQVILPKEIKKASTTDSKEDESKEVPELDPKVSAKESSEEKVEKPQKLTIRPLEDVPDEKTQPVAKIPGPKPNQAVKPVVPLKKTESTKPAVAVKPVAKVKPKPAISNKEIIKPKPILGPPSGVTPEPKVPRKPKLATDIPLKVKDEKEATAKPMVAPEPAIAPIVDNPAPPSTPLKKVSLKASEGPRYVPEKVDAPKPALTDVPNPKGAADLLRAAINQD